MTKNKIENPKLYKFLDIKYSYKSGLEDIMNFVKQLKPIVEKEDKRDFENYISAINSAFKKAGLDVPSNNEHFEPTEDQKKLIYKNLELPEVQPLNKNGHLWKSNFVLLISCFEYLISDIITFYYKHYPQNELDNTFEINLKNLRNFETIDDFINDIISKKVEALLYKSNEEQLKFLENTIKLDLSRKYIDWNLINEAVLRRHLIVHNNSKINKRYLNEADKKYGSDINDLKEGEKVFVGPKYFNKVYEELFLAGHLLIQNAWRKWLKEFEEVANAELIDLTYNGNIDKLFKVSEKIGAYGKELSTINNDFLFRINVNYCLSLKNQNKKEELQHEIDKIDISNLSPIYILAFHSLQDNCEDALKYIRHAKSVDNLEFEEVMEWPLFEGLRKKTEFIEKVHKIYRKKLQSTLTNKTR